MRGAAFSFILCTAALAQAPGGVLTGVVVDAATLNPVPEARVSLRGPALPGEQVAVTDAGGAFEMTLLPAGTYSLSIAREGFQTYAPEGLLLKGGRTRVRIAVAPVADPAPAAEKAGSADGALEFTDGMTAPSMISGPPPEYTPQALERGVEGLMLVRCVITAEGQVRGCKVTKGLPFMNIAVVDALEKRRYSPARAQGKPVDVYYTFSIRLTLPAR
jgi:TonB family protein